MRIFTKLIIMVSAFLLIAVPRMNAQGSFQNLNFEEANVSGYTPNANNVPINLALPGWNTGNSTVSYNEISAGGYLVSLVDSNAGFGIVPLQGKYSVCLFAGTASPASISQTGLVPIGSMSVQMDIESLRFGPATPFTVLLGGQQITMTPLENLASYTVYGGNISSFAGETETLTITQLPPASSPPSGLELDNIVFSPDAVPESNSWAIMSCGTALIFAFNLMRRKS